MIKAYLIGNLVDDPEIKETRTGCMAIWRVAAESARFKDRDTGEWESKTVYMECKHFAKEQVGIIRLAQEHMSKGTKVFVDGRLEEERWDDKTTGQKRSKIVMIVDKVDILSPRLEKPKPAPKPEPELVQDDLPF